LRSLRNGISVKIDFILGELNLPSKSLILDMGCGTGRH
jgi:cyclopropane fatty-acyl-phospholipid synthase-like methyltransferase